MKPLKQHAKPDEEAKETMVMRDFNPNQKNDREDGEIGPDENDEQHREEHHQQGIPCQTQ